MTMSSSSSGSSHRRQTNQAYDGDQQDRADRLSLRRVAGMSTELADITEVEYRQLLLERVVLVSVWTNGSEATPTTQSPSSRRWPRRPDRRCSKV